ncbi:cupin domain-containing protein, partial [Burkholderia cenocepacia]|uniref:cupin domain-containing protein n=1 Tax=Burkholderia cenocepacia TaxID=95486 RepID=UPI00406CB2B1
MTSIVLCTLHEHPRSHSTRSAAAPSTQDSRLRRVDASDRRDLGVNLMRVPPGDWSSQRHWRSDEDEFVYVLAGELVMIEDGGATVLRAGDCAAFPKHSGNGHHLINRSGAVAVYREVGWRSPDDVITCPDIDMMS